MSSIFVRLLTQSHTTSFSLIRRSIDLMDGLFGGSGITESQNRRITKW